MDMCRDMDIILVPEVDGGRFHCPKSKSYALNARVILPPLPLFCSLVIQMMRRGVRRTCTSTPLPGRSRGEIVMTSRGDTTLSAEETCVHSVESNIPCLPLLPLEQPMVNLQIRADGKRAEQRRADIVRKEADWYLSLL